MKRDNLLCFFVELITRQDRIASEKMTRSKKRIEEFESQHHDATIFDKTEHRTSEEKNRLLHLFKVRFQMNNDDVFDQLRSNLIFEELAKSEEKDSSRKKNSAKSSSNVRTRDENLKTNLFFRRISNRTRFARNLFFILSFLKNFQNCLLGKGVGELFSTTIFNVDSLKSEEPRFEAPKLTWNIHRQVPKSSLILANPTDFKS